MTTMAAAARISSQSRASKPRAWLGTAAIAGGVTAIVGARWLATVAGVDALAVGAGFGLALTAAWFLAHKLTGREPQAARVLATRRTGVALAVGIAFGLALVAGAAAGASIGGFPAVPGLGRPAAPFLPWAAITVVVATAEEGILRGVLFDRVRASGGTLLAVSVTTIAFALLHVPLYGWHVVPLDLAVGLGFAGLRLSTRSIIAPAAAHAVADLATWWL